MRELNSQAMIPEMCNFVSFINQQGRKCPLDTPKRMIERERERERGERDREVKGIER